MKATNDDNKISPRPIVHVSEKMLRRIAARRGLHLRKYRANSKRNPRYGKYCITRYKDGTIIGSSDAIALEEAAKLLGVKIPHASRSCRDSGVLAAHIPVAEVLPEHGLQQKPNCHDGSKPHSPARHQTDEESGEIESALQITTNNILQSMYEEDAQLAGVLPERFVEIEENWTWNIRLLPVEMGIEKKPFVRLARHWWNDTSISCPKWTPKGFGGDPNISCPVCTLAARLEQEGNGELQQLGFRTACKITWQFHCIVLDQQDPRGRVKEMSIEEVLNPYVIEMTKITWDDLKKHLELAVTRQKAQISFLCLDLKVGCNFLATNTAKGVRLDRLDPDHVFYPFIDTNGPDWDKYIEKIWTRIRPPVITRPTEKQMAAFVTIIKRGVEQQKRVPQNSTDWQYEHTKKRVRST